MGETVSQGYVWGGGAFILIKCRLPAVRAHQTRGQVTVIFRTGEGGKGKDKKNDVVINLSLEFRARARGFSRVISSRSLLSFYTVKGHNLTFFRPVAVSL